MQWRIFSQHGLQAGDEEGHSTALCTVGLWMGGLTVFAIKHMRNVHAWLIFSNRYGGKGCKEAQSGHRSNV